MQCYIINVKKTKKFHFSTKMTMFIILVQHLVLKETWLNLLFSFCINTCLPILWQMSSSQYLNSLIIFQTKPAMGSGLHRLIQNVIRITNLPVAVPFWILTLEQYFFQKVFYSLFGTMCDWCSLNSHFGFLKRNQAAIRSKRHDGCWKLFLGVNICSPQVA